MPKKYKNSRRIRWANNINKPLVTSEFINMSNNAIYARESVAPSKTRHIENNNENNINMSNNIRNTRWNNRRSNSRNTTRNNRRKPISRKRRRPSNWNNGSNANNENNEIMSNSSRSNNNNYDSEENAEIARKMAALKATINRERR